MPATPTTSPPWTASETSLDAVLPVGTVGRHADQLQQRLGGHGRPGMLRDGRLAQLGDVGVGRVGLPEHHGDDPFLELVRAGRRQVLGSQPADHATQLEHRDPVADLDGLVQLVGDEDDGQAPGLETAEHLLQLGGALGCEHGGGLVEDEHPRAAPERLDDLDLLLLTQGQAAGTHVRVDLHAERRGQLARVAPGGSAVEDQARVGAHHQVLEHRERRDEAQVLVHHAHAELATMPG